ncbi:antibiotic biosynthesis monooxygenase [Desulfobacterales bacterium HSG16]|nr:antibiotic biosynthesis monooxygenase [Desulfobacterales bacterium HSG16]
MLAKIIIKRHFRKGKTLEVLSLLSDLRSMAMKHPGYVSGETLMENNDPQSLIVISTWQNIESWNSWKENDERNKYEDMLAIYQEEPTTFDEYLLGTALI